MTNRRFPARLRAGAFLAFLLLPLLTFAQQAPAPRPINHNDYDNWRSIRDQQVLRDGKYLAYDVVPVDGDGDLVLRELNTGRDQHFPIGYTGGGGAAAGGGGRGGRGGGAAGGRIQFTADSKTLIAQYSPTKAEQPKAGRGGRGKAGGKGKATPPPEEKTAQEKADQPAPEQPRGGVALIDVATGKVTKLARARGTLLAENGAEYLLYQHDTGAAANAGGDAPEGEGGAQPPARGNRGGGKAGGQRGGKAGRRGGGGGQPTGQVQGGGGRGRQFGSDLIVRRLADGHETTIPDVVEYSMTKDGRLLVYTVASRAKEETDGVYAVVPGDTEPPFAILAGKGRYQRMTWDREQMQLAFVSDRDDAANSPAGAAPANATPHKIKVYVWSRPITEPKPTAPAKENGPALPANSYALSPVGPYYYNPYAAGLALDNTTVPIGTAKSATVVKAPATPQPAVEVLSNTAPGFKSDWIISDNTTLSFTRDGRKLFLTTGPAPKPPAPPQPQTGEATPKITVELWHYHDDFIQPMQRVRGNPDNARSFSAVVSLADRHFVQLGDEALPTINHNANGDFGIGSSDKAYRMEVAYDGNYSDYYMVNLSNNSRKQVLRHHSGGMTFSPGGQYITYFDGKDYQAINVATGATNNLTRGLGVPMTREDHDTPNAAPPHGLGGWLKDDKAVLIYDHFDIWQVNPDGTGAKNLTGGAGRRDQIQFRVNRLDQSGDDAALDPAKPMLLHAVSERLRDTGFFRLRPGAQTPEMLVMAGRAFGNPVKAKNADTVILTATTFSEPPDLYVTTPDFREMHKVTDVFEKEMAPLAWGKAELINYKNSDGVPLQGILIKPGNYEPGKKYPMMVYIYEKLSQGLHSFHAPGPGTSINPTYYASNGYIVLMPDIVYTVGHPGQSALKCVLPAIQAVADMGIVDEKAIGIQGHSWGGYQIAYMVTQTNRFKAAEAGAAVSNMISAYDGIRWGTGLPRQFQYEKTQSRIGGTIWDSPTLFLENSPIFHANRVQTPLLLLNNDQDDAVPWYQGIEYYLALRRLGKEVYMFNYPGELHGLRNRTNQKDFTVRMQEFFDHHLKGAPKPEWMEKGIPYADRQRDPGK